MKHAAWVLFRLTRLRRFGVLASNRKQVVSPRRQEDNLLAALHYWLNCSVWISMGPETPTYKLWTPVGFG